MFAVPPHIPLILLRWDALAIRCGGPEVIGFRPWRYAIVAALALPAVSFVGATLPDSIAGAANASTITCGTLLVPGTGSYSGTNFQFTEFTTGSATRDNGTANGSSDGAVAYGGALNTFTSSPYFTAASALSPPASQPTVVIGGTESYNLVAAEGSVLVSGGAVGPITLDQAGATLQQNVGAAGLPFSFPSIQTDLATCSTNYGPNATTTMGTIAVSGTSLQLKGTGSTNVFSLPSSDLSGITTTQFSVPSGSTTLINVTAAGGAQTLSLMGVTSIEYGCSATFTSGCVVPTTEDNTSVTGVERDDTVWNFAPASFPASSTITLDSWQGTVVAPRVALTLNAGFNVCGSVFVTTITGAGNTKYCPFGGTMPATANPLPALPEGLPIALGGMGALAVGGALLVRRRRILYKSESPTA
jgi:choice-of-anchor A domain-containing protein